MPDETRVDVGSTLRDLDTRIAKLEQAHAHENERAASLFVDLKDLGEFGPVSEGGLPILPEAPIENLILLGYNENVAFSINQSEGTAQAYQDVDVTIPDGTTHVVAFMRSWMLAYGEMEIQGDKATIRHFKDHHLGLANVNVRVRSVGAQTASIRAMMVLRDDNGDDRWTGLVHAVALFMGPHP